MVGPIRKPLTNFHSISDLAKSDVNPYQMICHLFERVPPHLPSIPSLKVKMQPSPAESLKINHLTIDIPASTCPLSPAFSDDSGYGQDMQTPIMSPCSVNVSSQGFCEAENSLGRHKRYRKQRTVFETNQLKTLEDSFLSNPYPSSEYYLSLANRISVDESRLRIWFQNRRARSRRSQRLCPIPGEISLFRHELRSFSSRIQNISHMAQTHFLQFYSYGN